MRGRRLGPLGSRFWGVDVRSLVPVPSLTHHSMEYCSKIYFLVVVSFFWIHCFARNATHSKFTASSGRLSRSRISLKILSALIHGGLSRKVSNDRSSFKSPFLVNEPTVSQKHTRLMKFSWPSLPLGNLVSNSSRLMSFLSSDPHHLSALTMGSEKRICMTLSRTCASSGRSRLEAGILWRSEL